tara:strand:+ start:184 stop:414 length:231 start_codon:yes stop_codon:yes gene_type:complete
MAKMKKSKSFEDSITRLEQLVDKMESGDTSLEQSLELFEEGMDLIESCQNMLGSAEKRVQKYIQNSDGSFKIKDSK